MSTEIAATSGFATITSATSLSPKTKTLSIICRSSSSICPCCVERETSMRSSASECTSRSAPGGSRPKLCRIASVVRRRTQTTGPTTTKNARAAVALVLELDDPGAARRDEAVLRGHEEGVEQDQDRNPDQIEEECHALTSRAWVLGGFSSNSPAGV